MNMTRFLISGLIFVAFVPGNVWAQTSGPESPLSVEQLGRLPLAFEKHGDGFVARGQGYVIGLEGGKLVVVVAPKDVAPRDNASRVVSLELVGAGAGRAVPGGELPGKVNYIHGNDPRKWQIGLATYERIAYPNAKPGIDVVYYGNLQQLEFDLVAKPGSDPEAIRLKVRGAGRLSIDGSGALSLGEAAGGFRLAPPRIYQEVNGGKKRIPGHYAIVGGDEVAFRIDPWDHKRPLVIDPTIVWSSELGGGTNTSGAQAIGVDSLGNVIITGYTAAVDFALVNAAQDIFKGSQDIFVAKINSTGTALIYSTYLGGSASQSAAALAVDSTDAVWVTGSTQSTDFPLMNAAQTLYGGGTSDAFAAKLSSTGVLEVSTYLGGDAADYGSGIAVDINKNAYVTGSTYGTFPTTLGVLQTGSGNGFVTKYNSTGTMEYSTEFGGAGTYGQAIAVDGVGDAYVTGTSYATTVPGMPGGSAQPANKGAGDAYVAKINPNATAYGYFTFLGGTGLDQGKAIAIDSSNEVFVAGQTSSAGLVAPAAASTLLTGATGGPVQGDLRIAPARAALALFTGSIDGFAAKLNAAGSAFDYFTYFPGNRTITLTGMALDAAQDVYLTGYTDSTNVSVLSPLMSAFPGNPTSLFSSGNSAATWAAADLNIPGAVLAASINPSGTSEVVMTEAGIDRSTNGGTSWAAELDLDTGQLNQAFLARPAEAPSTVYAYVCCGQIYRSTDDGVAWTLMGTTDVVAGGLVADPLTAGTVYLYGQSSPSVLKSTDGGTTWNPAATGLPAQVRSMVAASDGALYAGGGGFGIYKSTNQGGTWTAVNTGLPPNSYAFYANSLSASGTR